MKKYIYIIVAILVVVAGAYAFSYTKDTTGDAPQGKLVTGSDTETFSGTITAVNTGCFVDAICSVTVDDKEIILVKGGRGMPEDTKVGTLIGVESIGDLEGKIGAHANVYATTTPEGDYSLYGSDLYYVEVVDIKE